MPYTIVTKDGIRLRNIPDNVKEDDPRLKQRVAQERAMRMQKIHEEGDRLGKLPLKVTNPGEYDPTSDEWKAKYGASSDERSASPIRENLGAGFKDAGIGAMQLLLPKSGERAFGITDEYIDTKRARDAELAGTVTGGGFLQGVGAAAPTLAIPGGAIARGLTALPKVGGALAKAGVGSRWLPTMTAEGAGLGAISGAAMPTKDDESTLGNAVLGAAGGAAIPGALGLGGYALRPLVPALGRRSTANKLGEMMDTSPAALAKLEGAINQSNQRIVNSPQSLSALTQNAQVAMAEKAARANPEFAAGWHNLDQNASNARWSALDDVLGDEASVTAAREATDTFASVAIPQFTKGVHAGKLATGIRDLLAASKVQLQNAVDNRADWAANIFKYLREEIKASNRSPQALWNIRQNLRKWQEGRPPVGRENTRAPKSDRAIQKAISAIDETLNGASNGKWSRLLDDFGAHFQKEGAQKAGQNIRNEFLDEVLKVAQATTSKGNPAITRAKLVSSLKRHGKNDFGETLDWRQRNVIDQVIDDLQADEILGRVTKSMTGGGGSQTAPLAALLEKSLMGAGGNTFEKVASVIGNYGRRRQQKLINQILQSPEDALFLLRKAAKMRRPLTKKEGLVLMGVRALASQAPAAAVLGVAGSNSGAEEVDE